MVHLIAPTTKPIAHPDFISLLMPTRGRPEKFAHAMRSLEQTVQDPSMVDIWVYVDEDDAMMRKWIDHTFHINIPIHYHVGPRTRTLVDTVNILWKTSTSQAGIYIPIGDDFVNNTVGWDRTVREMFHAWPDRMVLGHFINTLTDPDDMVFPVFSAEWINALGYVFTGLFPFWFEDYWLDEIAQMIQRKQRLEVYLEPLGGKGKTQRMRNVPFWYRFFTNTIDERMAIAAYLRNLIFPNDCEARHQSETAGMTLAQTFWTRNKGYDDARCVGWERDLAAKPQSFSAESTYHYMQVENDAIHLLIHKLEPLMANGDNERVLEVLDALIYPTHPVGDVQYLRAVYLAQSENWLEAEQAAREQLALQPGDEKTFQLLAEIAPKLPPSSPFRIATPGVKYLNEGNLEGAYGFFLTLTFQFPHFEPGHILLGETLMRLNRLTEAETIYHRVLRRFPESVAARTGLAYIYIRAHRLDDAARLLEDADRLQPDVRAHRQELMAIRRLIASNAATTPPPDNTTPA